MKNKHIITHWFQANVSTTEETYKAEARLNADGKTRLNADGTPRLNATSS